MLLLYALILAGVAAGATFAAWLRFRRLRERAVVQTLNVIISRNLPLLEGLRAAARHERGRLRSVYELIAARLELGVSVSTALRSALPTCSGATIGALQGAEMGGTLPSVVRSLAADQRRDEDAERPRWPIFPYALGMAFAVSMLLGFLFVTVMPKFREIYADFEITLPPLTQSLLDAGSGLNTYGGLISVIALVLAPIAFQLSVGRRFMTRLPDRRQWTFSLLDTLAWYLPLCRRVAETRAWARQLPLMSIAVRAGQDLVAAARQAARADANHHARRRLRRWAGMMESGVDPIIAARRLRFPNPVVSALELSQHGRDLAATLDYAGSYYRSLLTHWERVASSVAVPVVVVLFGVAVGYVVVALLLPLSDLIHHMAAEVD